MPTFFVGLLIWSIFASACVFFIRGASERAPGGGTTESVFEPAAH